MGAESIFLGLPTKDLSPSLSHSTALMAGLERVRWNEMRAKGGLNYDCYDWKMTGCGSDVALFIWLKICIANREICNRYDVVVRLRQTCNIFRGDYGQLGQPLVISFT